MAGEAVLAREAPRREAAGGAVAKPCRAAPPRSAELQAGELDRCR